MANLPNLNYTTHLSIDDFQEQSNVDEKNLLDRFKMSFGNMSGISPRFGVIDQIDPKNLIETDTNRPLLVSRSNVDNLRISVSIGAAVCPNGTIVQLSSAVFDTQLVRTNLDDIIVVFLENEIIPYGESRVSKYNVPGQVRTIQNPDNLRSALLSEYNNSSLFSSSRKENIVVIAVIKIVSSSTSVSGLDLAIDYSDITYSFNRPWFSIVDSEHRASKGSGLVSPQNPHGNSINDFSTGAISFYAQFLQHGKILAKDFDIKGRPGYACVEKISKFSILVDNDGSVTLGSNFGGVSGTKYITLVAYPASVNSFHLVSHKSKSIAFDWIQGTNIVVVPAAENFDEDAIIYYNRVHAAEPSIAVLGNRITFDSIDDTREIAISGGLSVGDVTSNYIDFEGSGPVPRDYKIYLSSSKEYLKFPQLIQNTILLDSIGTQFVSLDINQYGPAQLSVALINAVPSSNLKVTIRIYGTNSQNAVITEDLTFDSTWQSIVLPSVEDMTNLKKTKSVFSKITGYQIIERVSDGSSSKIVVYAEIESGVANDLNDLLKIADVSWDGISLSKVIDCRKFESFLPGYTNKYSIIGNNYATINSLKNVANEDFSCPIYNDVISGYSNNTHAKSTIIFSDSVTNDDLVSITLYNNLTNATETKTLVATSSTPNRSIGQFKIGTASETRDDFALTLLDESFNSGFTCAANSSNKLDIIRSLGGVRGNSSISITTVVTQAIMKEGDVTGGYDKYAEAVSPQHRDVLNTKILPASEYDTTIVRDRYLSRAFPVNSNTLDLIIYGSSSYQVRYRVASNSTNFSKWNVLNKTSNNIYTISNNNTTKIQLEIFGKCSGYSLFER